MYYDFHALLVETNLKTQESNMHGLHGKLRRSCLEIFTEETYKKSRSTKFTSMISVKDMDLTTTWKRLCWFLLIMKAVSNHAKEYEKDEIPQEGFWQLFWCFRLSTILDRNPEADLRLSCLSLMSLIVIFVPCINKSPTGKGLASVCSVSFDDVSNCFLEFFLSIFKISWRR